MGIEIIFVGVIIGRGSNDDEIGVGVSGGAIEGGGEVELEVAKVALDILIANRR